VGPQKSSSEAKGNLIIDFTDAGGVAWSVRLDGVEEGGEVGAHRAIGPASGTWLRFESELEVRKLWRYPDDWQRMRADQLDRPRQMASVVIARFPRRPRPDTIATRDAPQVADARLPRR